MGGVWASAGRTRDLVWVGLSPRAHPLLTLLSVARITRQHASTGPTPLSEREAAGRPLELSAHRLWLGEMPGSWAEKSAWRQVRAGVGAQQQTVGSPHLAQVRDRLAPCVPFPHL